MSSDRQLVGRREFLVASSSCVVATAVLGPNLFASEGSASAGARIAVGFARAGEVASLIPASAIPSSDGAFISHGARIAVSGASGTPASPRARRAVELLTNFSYFEGARIENAPFRAWGSSRVTGAQGSPIRFTVPVDLMQKIDMTVVVETGEGETGAPSTRRRAMGAVVSGTRALPVSFSLQNDPAAVRLVRGFYVLVPLFDRDSEPAWSDFRLFQRDGRWTLVDGSKEAAAFEHLVLHISYAMA